MNSSCVGWICGGTNDPGGSKGLEGEGVGTLGLQIVGMPEDAPGDLVDARTGLRDAGVEFDLHLVGDRTFHQATSLILVTAALFDAGAVASSLP